MTAPQTLGDNPAMRVTAAILLVVGLGFLAVGAYRELRGGDASQEGLAVLRYDMHSSLLGRTMHQVAVVPPQPRGLVVLLHAQPVEPPLLEELRDLGRRAPAVVLVDGERRGRYDSYVLVEAVPDALQRLGLGQVAIAGEGAPEVADLDPSRFCAAQTSTELRPLVRGLRRCVRG